MGERMAVSRPIPGNATDEFKSNRRHDTSSGDGMQGERYQNTIALLLTVLVFASIPLIVNFLGGWFLWAPVLAALAVLPAAFLREAGIGTGLQAPAHGRAAVPANSLREG